MRARFPKLGPMKSAILVSVCLLLPTGVQAATCLRLSQVKSTDTSDGKILVLAMKNGEVWHGELKRPCSGIRFSGFRWNTDGDLICEDSQLLRVVATGAICPLGKLSLMPAQQGH